VRTQWGEILWAGSQESYPKKKEAEFKKPKGDTDLETLSRSPGQTEFEGGQTSFSSGAGKGGGQACRSHFHRAEVVPVWENSQERGKEKTLLDQGWFRKVHLRPIVDDQGKKCLPNTSRW